MALLEPKPVSITTSAGTTKTFVVGKFPAIQGREIISKYPVANVPKVGDYAVSEETMRKALGYCGVILGDGAEVTLTTDTLINQHCGDWETLMRLEWEVLRYNCDFFGEGQTLDFLKLIGPKLQAWISQISTALLPSLLEKNSPPSTN